MTRRRRIKVSNESVAVLSLDWGAASDRGRIRDENQDAFFGDPNIGVFLVSDGMGGHQAGAVASQIVSEVLPATLKGSLRDVRKDDTKAVRLVLQNTIRRLSARVHSEAESRPGLGGMGATLAMVLVRENQCYIANMGDSRVYLLRQSKLRQLSQDHSVVASLLREGQLDPTEARDHPARGQLTRYIGMADDAYPFLRTITIRDGDRILLCTDGLTGMVTDETIAQLLRQGYDPEVTCHALVDAANMAGGNDNVTATVVEWRATGLGST